MKVHQLLFLNKYGDEGHHDELLSHSSLIPEFAPRMSAKNLRKLWEKGSFANDKIASHPNLSSDLADEMAGSGLHVDVANALASRKDLSLHAQNKLVDSGHIPVWSTLAKNPNTHPDFLSHMHDQSIEDDSPVLYDTIKNPNTPIEKLRQVANSQSDFRHHAASYLREREQK